MKRNLRHVEAQEREGLSELERRKLDSDIKAMQAYMRAAEDTIEVREDNLQFAFDSANSRWMTAEPLIRTERTPPLNEAEQIYPKETQLDDSDEYKDFATSRLKARFQSIPASADSRSTTATVGSYVEDSEVVSRGSSTRATVGSRRELDSMDEDSDISSVRAVTSRDLETKKERDRRRKKKKNPGPRRDVAEQEPSYHWTNQRSRINQDDQDELISTTRTSQPAAQRTPRKTRPKKGGEAQTRGSPSYPLPTHRHHPLDADAGTSWAPSFGAAPEDGSPRPYSTARVHFPPQISRDFLMSINTGDHINVATVSPRST